MTAWFARFNQILIKFQVLQQNKKKNTKKDCNRKLNQELGFSM